MANISEEIQDGDNESKSNMEVDTEDRIEQEKVMAASEWATLEETEQRSSSHTWQIWMLLAKRYFLMSIQ